MLVTSAYSGKGNVLNSNKSTDIFIKLFSSITFILANSDSYITSLVSKQKTIDFIPTFFQINNIYSACYNLLNGNYTMKSLEENGKIINTYIIPYKINNKEQFVTIITYYDTISKILFYEIPREFSYNSIDQASVAINLFSSNSYSGEIAIPSSFISLLDPQIPLRFFPFNINPSKMSSLPNEDLYNISIEVKPSSESLCYGGPCNGAKANCPCYNIGTGDNNYQYTPCTGGCCIKGFKGGSGSSGGIRIVRNGKKLLSNAICQKP